jgi:Tfp pilus assembly protein PilF
MGRHALFLRSTFFILHSVIALALSAGCQHMPGPANQASVSALTDTRQAKLTEPQLADIEIAMGQTLEKQGQREAAAKAYMEALQRDSHRADACLRLAILFDQQGKFKDSAALYQRALVAKPGDAEVYCSVGYSFYLQSRWPEAEMNLRQAVALVPDHCRAHNNLGLVLSRTGCCDEALVEFKKAGCSLAEAHANLAYAQSLEQKWPEARANYERALTVDPSFTTAKKGLEELNTMVARLSSSTDPIETVGVIEKK